MDPKSPEMQAMMASFMQNAQKMQENMRKAYEEMNEKNKFIVVTGKAGGDLVTAHVSLQMQIVKIEFKPQLFEEKSEVIMELVTAAVNQGIRTAQQRIQQEMMEISKKSGMPTDFSSFFK